MSPRPPELAKDCVAEDGQVTEAAFASRPSDAKVEALPLVSGVVENISTLNRLKPWISDLIQNQVYHGQEMSCELTTEYDHRSDVYNFKLIFEKC